jgi:hypothetical protein
LCGREAGRRRDGKQHGRKAVGRTA